MEIKRLSSILTLLFLVTATGFAQGGGNAAITGTVVDPAGALIPHATVTMTRAGTDLKRSTTTNESGQFIIPSLPPSVYRFTVEAPGFKTYAQDVTLLADESGSLQVQMQ